MKKEINLTEIIELALILIALCFVGYIGFLNDDKDKIILEQQKVITQQATTIEEKQSEINRLNMISDDWYIMFRECLRTSYDIPYEEE